MTALKPVPSRRPTDCATAFIGYFFDAAAIASATSEVMR